MWVLIINPNFATAEPQHFEMQSPNKKIFWSKGLFYSEFEPETTKTIIYDLSTDH